MYKRQAPGTLFEPGAHYCIIFSNNSCLANRGTLTLGGNIRAVLISPLVPVLQTPDVSRFRRNGVEMSYRMRPRHASPVACNSRELPCFEPFETKTWHTATFTRPICTFVRPPGTLNRPTGTFKRPNCTFIRPNRTFIRSTDTFMRPTCTFMRSTYTLMGPNPRFHVRV